MVEKLHLYMNGLKVGVLSRQFNGAHSFIYDANWLAQELARPISLSLPLREQAYHGEEVINFFDNLLPDNPMIRERIAQRFQVKTKQPFDLLAKIGRDAAGAITLLAEGEELSNHRQITGTPLDDEHLAEVLHAYQYHIPLGMLEGVDDFRISVAGAQEKTALLFHHGQWYLPHGLTPTTHIIKLPIGEIKTPKHTLDLSKSVDNELICLRLCAALGLPTAKAEILQLDGIRALVVERFDRRLSKQQDYYLRLPYEDFCQVYGKSSAQKYESDGGIGIAEIMHKLQYSACADDTQRFMRSQVVFYLLAAIDGHAKNFSIALESQGRYQLAPLYDVISAYPMLSGKGWHSSDLKLAMSLRSTKKGKKWLWQQVKSMHFLETAKYVVYSERQMKNDMDELCQSVPQVIDEVGNNLPKDIDENIRDLIFEGLRKTAKNFV